ncbi:MAG: AAA family ATPase [Candidatus Bathyarchaeota archaeon]|nr:AAA family ATPase [Candidatus Bathyarchaeota archaeon]
MTTKTLAFHSSRGGTGKTVIATNLATIWANKGLKIALLDLDFRAPSLAGAFSKAIKKQPKYWLNDFISGRCKIEQTLIDVSSTYRLKGKLYLGLANPSIEAIRSTMDKSRAWEVSAVKRLFSMRKTLFKEMNIDYIILDTSPGLQYSSINAVVSSDISIIVTTNDEVDLKGSENLIENLYLELDKKPVVLINKVLPETQLHTNKTEKELINKIENQLKSPIIAAILCYCDVLQAKRTSILAIEKPNHAFVKNLETIAKTLFLTNKLNFEE